jgi:hypothetical protein
MYFAANHMLNCALNIFQRTLSTENNEERTRSYYAPDLFSVTEMQHVRCEITSGILNDYF